MSFIQLFIKMEFDSFKFIFGVCIIPLVYAGSVHTVFQCYGDVCNFVKVHQFCSNAFKYCRNCDTIKEDCGTAAQPLNCTAFCIGSLVAEALKQKKEKDDDSCLVLPVMMNIAKGQVSVPQHNDSLIAIGSELVYSCDNGYTLNGPSILKCMRNGTWEPTTMPYCSDNALTDIAFRHSTIVLSVICFFLLPAFVLLCVLYTKKSNKSNLSRTSTGSSLNHDEEPLIDINKQKLHHENERPPVSAGSPRGTDATCTENKTVTLPAVPSAPPAEENKREEEAGQKPSYKTSNDNTQVIVNNQFSVIIDGAPRPAEAKETFEDETRNDNFANDQTSTNRKSIDEKMPTEESDGIDAVEETNDEKKGRGTKPLPARDADSQSRAESSQEMFEAKKATLKGPQPVPAVNEENIQTPTKENAESIAMVGIHGSTFQKNDIKTNETQFTEKSEDPNYTQELAALKEV